MCVQLAELGCAFALSSYYGARSGSPVAWTLWGEKLKKVVVAECDGNYRAYGARKMWLHLRGRGIDVVRCIVERLMRALGLPGVRRGRARRMTVAEPAASWAEDLVERGFRSLAPDRLWVADFACVSTRAGWV